ncbi:MAG: glycosyl transferase [Cytophagales bacterium]|nr:MAG: glycosyl transferase [Cytophagales bacterium]
MKIIFTVCSMNYLGQAKTLAQSVTENAPEYKFIYGLADKINNRDLRGISKTDVLEVADLNIENFEWMVKNYNIVEFATAVKPFYFNYLFQKYPQATEITYLDPDIKIFTNLSELSAMHQNYEIILTPHFTKPIRDNKVPTEKHVFNTGIYNLGFVSMKRGVNTTLLIDWWSNKLKYECILDLSRGYFVDQLWMELAPIYFDNVLVSKHPGMNFAHWNFHERTATCIDGKYYVNNEPLIFFHFSHYKPSQPEQLAAFHTRFSFYSRPDLEPLYQKYRTELIENKYFDFIKEPCFYLRNENLKKYKKYWSNLIRFLIPVKVKIIFGKYLK